MEPALARKHTERRTLDIAAAPPQRVLLGVANLSPDDVRNAVLLSFQQPKSVICWLHKRSEKLIREEA